METEGLQTWLVAKIDPNLLASLPVNIERFNSQRAARSVRHR